MYILIRADKKKVLGYTVWTGWGNQFSIDQSFGDVDIFSFESNEKEATVRLFSTKEHAFQKSVEISEKIQNMHAQIIELDIMPLDVYINHIERWGQCRQK